MFGGYVKKGILGKPQYIVELQGHGKVAYLPEDAEKWNLLEIKDTPAFPNTLHDAFIDHVIFTPSAKSRYLKLAFTNENDVMLEVIDKTI